MSLEREMTLNDYVHVIKRRFPYVLGFFFLVFLASIAFALKLSPVYQSTATILIESQQVKSDTVKEPYSADRFETLKQVVMTKDNLLKIAQKYKLYGLDKKPDLSSESIVQSTRSNIKIEPLKADAQQWGEKPTFAFQISFKHYVAEDTYSITKDLVKLFLDENDRASKEKVTETADFFSKEAEKQKIALEKIEKEVANYKERHSNSLPENKEMKVASLERLEADLRATQREFSATQAELRSLDVSLESAKAGIGLTPNPEAGAGISELEKAKAELAKISSIYNENHPSVRALQRKIEALEKNNNNASDKPSVTAQSVMVQKVQAQIDTANARLKSLEKEESTIRAKMNQTEGLVLQSAQTEGELGTLLRDYENAKAAYADIKNKQDVSKIAKNIEMDNKGERFQLIEAPIFPEKPIAPNRLLIILAGFFVAIFCSVGGAVLIEALDQRVRGVDALVSILKIQPLATIPYITNQAELKRKKHIVSYTLKTILIVILIILLSVHFFVMPLDKLMSMISARF